MARTQTRGYEMRRAVALTLWQSGLDFVCTISAAPVPSTTSYTMPSGKFHLPTTENQERILSQNLQPFQRCRIVSIAVACIPLLIVLLQFPTAIFQQVEELPECSQVNALQPPMQHSLLTKTNPATSRLGLLKLHAATKLWNSPYCELCRLQHCAAAHRELQ